MRRLFTLSCAPLLLVLLIARSPAAEPDPNLHKPVIRGKLIGSGGDIAVFNSDGTVVVTCGGGEARAWDARTCKALSAPVVHDAPVQQCRFVRGGAEVVSISEYDARRWEVTSGKRLGSLSPPGGIGELVDGSADGTMVAGTKPPKEDGTGAGVVIYDLQSGRKLREFGQGRDPSCVLFSPDGTVLLVGEANGATTNYGQRFHLWDVKQGRERCKPIDSDCTLGQDPQLGTVPAVFTNDSSRVVISHSSWFEVLDIRDGHRICDNSMRARTDLFEFRLIGLAVSLDGTKVVAVRGGDMRTWNAASGDPLTPEFDQKVYAFSVNQNATLLAGTYTGSGKAVADQSERIGLWDLTACKKLLDLDKDGGRAMAFGPDGDCVTVGNTRSTDTTIWNLN